jgi:hypothetical protein
MSEAAPNPAPRRKDHLFRLAIGARLGDLDALRELHFGTPEQRARWKKTNVIADSPEFMAAATVEMEKWMAGRLSWQPRPARPGQIDFHRIHAMALDHLAELIAHILPNGREQTGFGGARWCWVGSHPQRPEMVEVCLLIGAWNEPNSGRAGRDLCSLYSHMFGVSAGRGAHMLAEFCGLELRQYAA